MTTPEPTVAPAEPAVVGRLTKAQRRALVWFSMRESAHLFGANDPSLTTVRKLRDRGLVAIVTKETGQTFGFAHFAITPAGLAALQSGEKG